MGARSGDNDDCTFTLPGHEYLTPFESANKFAEHFSKVSKEFTPLGVDKLPVRVQNKLESPEEDSKIPTIEEYQIFEKIKQANKPKVGVPGDVPRRIVEEFSAELCTPLRKVFQSIMNSAKLGPVKWPLAWKKEYGTPLQKKTDPMNEDDLRIISLTPLISKILERFVVN